MVTEKYQEDEEEAQDLVDGDEPIVDHSAIETILEEPEDEGDGLEDIFEVTEEDVMGGDNEDLSDLVDVTPEDVIGEGGDISDLVDVSNDDVMGGGSGHSKRRYVTRPKRVERREPPPSSAGGIRG